MSEMTFQRLHADIDLNLLDSVFTDCESVFLRRVKRNRELRPEDFESKWEKNDKKVLQGQQTDFINAWNDYKRRLSEHNMHEIIGLKGISTDKCIPDSLSELIAWHKCQLESTPSGDSYLCYYRLRESGGVFRHTPQSDNYAHHDLLKSDQFSLEDHIESLKIVHMQEPEALECP